MVFAISGVETSPFVPPLVSFAVSFMTSMGGVSGAFLLLPYQMSVLGFTSPAVSSTNQLYNVVAIPSGVYRYIREGRMVWPLAGIVVVGTLPGVLVGAIVRVAYLPDPGRFKLFAGLVLLYIGAKLVKDVMKRASGVQPAATESSAEDQAGTAPGGQAIDTDVEPCRRVAVEYVAWSTVGLEFDGRKFEFSTWGVFALSLVVGIVGGVYGIGGGAIIAPFLVTVFGLPVYVVAGAALTGTFVASVAGVVFYQAIAPFLPHLSVSPDWLLGSLFGLGGFAGMYLGARCQRHMPERVIKGMLALVILIVALRYLGEPLRELL